MHLKNYKKIVVWGIGFRLISVIFKYRLMVNVGKCWFSNILVIGKMSYHPIPSFKSRYTVRNFISIVYNLTMPFLRGRNFVESIREGNVCVWFNRM